MVVFIFSISDKLDKKRFFEKNFLLANIKLDIVLKIFSSFGLIMESYIMRDVPLTTKRVELIGKKEFVVVTLNPDYKGFVLYITILSINSNISNKV